MALKAEGVSVPEEIAVIGFDDMNLVRFLTPPLTTVHAPIERIGNLAVDSVIKMINHEVIQQTTILPTRLVIRQSCGCKGDY
jgi:DNA-binding LacI/PurR family transcriptional regulator